MKTALLAAAYHHLHAEATALAGGLRDLAQRAAVYRHIFRASQGNHAFPLIAAHGALWAGGHFRFGARLGRWLVWQYAWSAAWRREQLRSLEAFCDALRDINRRVCIDTYVTFFLSQRFADHPDLGQYVRADILGLLRMVHDACRRGRPLTEAQRREVFQAHFLLEQETIVGETLERAAAEFRWPLVKSLALRPRVRFAFLPPRTCIAFRNFADKQERIRNGLRAFDAASHVGWRHVEASLADYGLLPTACFLQPDRHFAQLVAEVSTAASAIEQRPDRHRVGLISQTA